MDDKHPLTAYRESFEPEMKRAELARKLKVARITVKRWETGAQQIAPGLVPKIVEETGIPAAKLRPDLTRFYLSEAAE